MSTTTTRERAIADVDALLAQSKVILLNNRVKEFTGADVIEVSKLILARESAAAAERRA